jgi:hypothetical protein
MADCVIEPYEGIAVHGYGEVLFDSSAEFVEQLLGQPSSGMANEGKTLLYYQDTATGNPRGLSVRFDFDDSGRCEAIEFLWPRRFPPRIATERLAGPTLRQAGSVLVGMGYAPWNETGPIPDLAARCRPGPQSDDTLDFHEIGVSLWSERSTETDGVDFGEYLLDTVLVWRCGYLEAAQTE